VKLTGTVLEIAMLPTVVARLIKLAAGILKSLALMINGARDETTICESDWLIMTSAKIGLVLP